MTEPMSDDELAILIRKLHSYHGMIQDGSSYLRIETLFKRAEALAEAQQIENAAMREIVRAVAEADVNIDSLDGNLGTLDVRRPAYLREKARELMAQWDTPAD